MTTRLAAIAAVLLLGFSCKLANKAPDTPVVFGPSAGAVGVWLTFTATATDPEGDSVSFGFDWSDSAGPAWTAFVASGDTVTVSKTFAYDGDFMLRVKSRDRKSKESNWSQFHAVTIANVWKRTFAGASAFDGYSVIQTSDGGFVVAASTAGEDGLMLMRLDAWGNLVWDTTFDGRAGDGDRSVVQTDDGGFVVVGAARWGGDVWLVRTDAAGNLVWDKTYGGTSGDKGYSLAQTSDGGFAITGYTKSSGAGATDIWLIRTDAAGNLLWDRTYGGASNEEGYSVAQTGDGGFIIAGYTYSYGAGDADWWLVRTDSAGNRLWDKTFGGGSDDRPYSVALAGDGGFIIAGYTRSFGEGSTDGWLIRTDAAGERLWDKTFGGSGDDAGCSVARTGDGGLVVTGYTCSTGEVREDVWLIRTDATGNQLWNRTFGGVDYDEGRSVVQTSDGGFAVAGWTELRGHPCRWLIRTDVQGNTAP
jgi:hypothetical protein